MARFYASIQGSRGEATRMGTPASGIHSHTRGWDIGANVRVFDEDGEDVCYIGISGGSNGAKLSKCVGTLTAGNAGEYTWEPAA